MSAGDAVIVTGAAGGIGQALCRAFEQAGDYVIGIDRVPAAAHLRHWVEADLARVCDDRSARDRALTDLRSALSGMQLRALVNNAALQVVKPFEALAEADWQETFAVNVLAPVFLVRGLLDALERSRGSVINIGSIHGRLTKPGFAAYAASKAALEGVTRSLAVELGGRVRVNCIAPAAVATPMLRAGFEANRQGLADLAGMHPAGRIAEADEVAQAALFLASERAAFVTGTVLSIDGGIGARLHDPS